MKRSQTIPLFFIVLLSPLLLFSSLFLPCEAAAPSASNTNYSGGSLAACQACWVKSRESLPDCAKVTDQEWQSVFDITDPETLSQTIPKVNGSMTCICSLVLNAKHILEDVCAPCPYEMVSMLANESFTFASAFGCTSKGRSQLVDNFVAPNTTNTTTTTTNSTTTTATATTTTDTATTDTTPAAQATVTDGSSSQDSVPTGQGGAAAAESSSTVAPTPNSAASLSKMHHLGPMFIAVIAAVVFA